MRAAPKTTNANSPPCASSPANSRRCRDVDAHRARDDQQRHDLQREQAREQRRDRAGRLRQQAEVDRHADRDEEEAEQQALERLDVGLERVRYSELASSTPARNAPSAIEMPASVISCAMPMTSSSANAVNTSRMLAAATMRSTGRVR